MEFLLELDPMSSHFKKDGQYRHQRQERDDLRCPAVILSEYQYYYAPKCRYPERRQQAQKLDLLEHIGKERL